MNSKSILLITHFLPPSHTAGTEQYTLGLGKALQAKGHNVTIFCAEDWDTGNEYWNGVTKENLEGLVVYRAHINWTKAQNPNRVLYDGIQVENWLDQFLDLTKFDIVHVTSTYSLGVGVLRSVKRAKIPLILTLMDFWFLCPSLQLLRSDGNLCDGKTTAWQCQSCLMAGSNIFQRIAKASIPDSVNSQIWGTIAQFNQISKQRGLRGFLLDMDERKKAMKETFYLPDIVISPSNIVQTMFAKNMDRSLTVLPYGHDLSWLKEYKGKLESNQVRFGYLGQIQRIKGVHLAIEAFIKADIGDQARLEIWGDYSRNQSYTNELNSIIKDKRSIFLKGRFDRSQLAQILSEIDILLVPSTWYENAPLVIQEAFATQTPVIATNLGGMSEAVLHEINGLLFSRNDPDDLSKQMARFISEKELLNRLISGIIRPKTLDEEIIELEVIYNGLLKRDYPPTNKLLDEISTT